MEKEIIQIRYPNTVAGNEQSIYNAGNSDNEALNHHFKMIQKNGEMAAINWIQVWRGERLIAEIKESVCDIYFK